MVWRANCSLPITEDKLLKISALFKAGGYKSVKNYLSRIKEFHITSGFDWNDRLDIISKKCARSALRGLGGAHRSEAFDLVAVCERLQDNKGALTKDGPINPVAMILTSTKFMLRELEASSLEVRDITFTEHAVSLRLPVSKVDWQAKGCTRTWNCLCDRQLPCVMHILMDHVKDLKEHKMNSDSMLFPTATGRVCSKQSVVDTIRKAVDMAGGSSKDTSGNWRISGHTFRITGTRTLCRWGLDPITIQLIGRWGSSAVLTYLSEAPLEGFHERLAGGGDWKHVKPFHSLAREQFNTDMDQWVDVDNLIPKHNALAEETIKLKHKITLISRQLEDTEHRLEGVAETVSTDGVKSEIWNVHNIISDVAEYLGDVFDGIRTLDFSPDPKLGRIASGHQAKDGEFVAWPSDPGNFVLEGPVELYLAGLEAHIRLALREVLEQARTSAESWEVGDRPRETWLDDYCAQLSLLATQIIWTEDGGWRAVAIFLETARAFEDMEAGSETAMRDYKRVNDDRIDKLIRRVQGESDKELRTKVITIITIDVHSRDVIESFVLQKVNEANDFRWGSQLRFYWTMYPPGSSLVSFTPPHQKTCLIKICDWATCYAYETWRWMGDGWDQDRSGMYMTMAICKMRHTPHSAANICSASLRPRNTSEMWADWSLHL
eukprot:s2113_g16.t1